MNKFEFLMKNVSETIFDLISLWKITEKQLHRGNGYEIIMELSEYNQNVHFLFSKLLKHIFLGIFNFYNEIMEKKLL